MGAESLFFSLLALIHTLARQDAMMLADKGSHGGYIGFALSQFSIMLIGRTLTILLLCLLVAFSLMLATRTSWATLVWRVRWVWSWLGVRLRAVIEQSRAQGSRPASASPCQGAHRQAAASA